MHQKKPGHEKEDWKSSMLPNPPSLLRKLSLRIRLPGINLNGCQSTTLVRLGVCLEWLGVAETAIGPCGIVGLTGEGSGRCGDGVVIRVVAEVREDVRGDGKPVGRYICYQYVARCAARERVDIK